MAELVDDFLNLIMFSFEDGIANYLLKSGRKVAWLADNSQSLVLGGDISVPYSRAPCFLLS